MTPSPMRHGSYWLEQPGPLPVLSERPPDRVDVLIVGSGYTGLNAALETARGGRSTLVLDKGDPGCGCSTRNGGHISTSIKPSLASLTRSFGAERARAIREEGRRALDWIEERVRSEAIDCDFVRAGRFHAAHTPAHYEGLVRDSERMRREEGILSEVVPRAELSRELGTDAYFGGLVYPRHASLHPGKYHRGLLNAALAAGVEVVGHCAATRIERSAGGFLVDTEKGRVIARDVIVATNGYTGPLLPWLQRRVIPIGSYIIATEELPESVIDRLFPTNRVVSDTCRLIYYFRAAPDRRRVLFGGRVSGRETSAAVSAPLLRDAMCRIFPELRGHGISHSWGGTVAYSFDELAHVGVHDGVHYSLGYCGSGVSMASYLGMRTGQKVLGLTEGRTAFDGLPHKTRPFYTGKPWFLPAVVSWYRWNDNRALRNLPAAARQG